MSRGPDNDCLVLLDSKRTGQSLSGPLRIVSFDTPIFVLDLEVFILHSPQFIKKTTQFLERLPAAATAAIVAAATQCWKGSSEEKKVQ